MAAKGSSEGGYSLSSTSKSGKAQQQNDDPSGNNLQASDNPPSPTLTRSGIAPKQSEGNPTQGESSALNDPVDVAASHGVTQVDAVASHGITQTPSHVSEKGAQSPDPQNKARPGQSQLGSSSAASPSNDEGSTSDDVAEQPDPAAGPQTTAAEAHRGLPSIIFLHDYHQEASKGDLADHSPPVASPTNLASNPNAHNLAQEQNTDPIAQELPGGGLAIGSQTLSLGQQTEIQGATISVGASVIALDGATYTRADIGGSRALSGTTAAVSDDEEPFTLLLPTKGFAGIASLTASLPEASVSAVLNQQSAVVSGSHGSPSHMNAGVQVSNNTDGDAGIGAANLRAFNQDGKLPATLTLAPGSQIGITSRGSSPTASNALTGEASAHVTLFSGVQIATTSRGSVSAASNASTGVGKPSLPAPSPFDSAATMLTAKRCLTWLSITLAMNHLGIWDPFA